MATSSELDSATDGMFVLETTEGDAFLGQLVFSDGGVVVHNGFVGRPHLIAQEDVASIQPAAQHPDVHIPQPRPRL